MAKTKAFIALTIQVEVDGDKWVARHQAEQLSSAFNQILRVGGAAQIWSSVIDETEADAVARLAQVTS